jgi:hypothetical protein
MFHPDQISKEKLENVSMQLGRWLDKTATERFRAAGEKVGASPAFLNNDELSLTEASAPPLATQPPSFRLGETFVLWSLGFDRITDGLRTGVDLVQLARPTGRWHHQIKINAEPVGFARSFSKDDALGLDVRQMFVSDLARYIDEALAWIDEFEVEHPDYAASHSLVRLLFVPAYQTHAFWLSRGDSGSWLQSLMSRAAKIFGMAPKQNDGKSDLLIIDAPSHLSALRPNTLLSSDAFLEAFRGEAPLGGLI